MNARADLATEVLRPMTVATLDGVMALEETIYPFPWTRGNFLDSLGRLRRMDSEPPRGRSDGYASRVEPPRCFLTCQHHGRAARASQATRDGCRAGGGLPAEVADACVEVRESNQTAAGDGRLGFATAGISRGTTRPEGRRGTLSSCRSTCGRGPDAMRCVGTSARDCGRGHRLLVARAPADEGPRLRRRRRGQLASERSSASHGRAGI